MAKTTKKDFELFKKECQKWQGIFGLQDVDIAFNHQTLDEDVFAQCNFSAESRSALLELNDTWDNCGGAYPLNSHNIKLSAFHEVCHIFTGSLVSRAKTRHIMEHEISEADHMIIRVLENVLFPKY